MSTQVVIGASGQVGEHLLRAVAAAGHRAVGTYCSHPVDGMAPLDVRRPNDVQTLMATLRPSVIYLPAAMANVEHCEEHPDETYATNVAGTANVVRAANEAGTTLVYFSSDYVFDGKAGPYAEDDPVNPICEYGRQKVAAEHYVACCARQGLIVRTTGVYGWERQGKNFVCRLRDTLARGDTLTVPVDQIGSPTYAPNLAEAVVALVEAGARGVFHVAGPELADRYEFARAAARAFGLDGNLIRPAPTSELGQIAPRPLRAGMDSSKAQRLLSMPLLGYRQGLAAMAASAEADT